MPLFMGIDPGASGGIAVLDAGRAVVAYRMPSTEGDLAAFFVSQLGGLEIRHCFLERVHSMPDQGVASSFTFGRGVGVLVGLLLAHGIPFEEISPQTWLKILGIPTRTKRPRKPMPGVDYPAEESHRDWKNRLKATAQKMFPGIDVTLYTADALLLAKACERLHVGWTAEEKVRAAS